MRTRNFRPALLLASIMLLSGCSGKQEEQSLIRSFPVSSLEGVVAPDQVELDNEVSFDGNGSLRIEAAESTTVRLYETGDIDVEKARLIYRARIRVENLIGQAFLEMLCVFGSQGEFFSRGLNSVVAGNEDWTEVQTEFFLKENENPDNVKLNVVVKGSGTVWIDDISLVRAPLR
jgi:hypothetical protein